MANELRENKISYRYVNVGPDRVPPNLAICMIAGNWSTNAGGPCRHEDLVNGHPASKR